MISNFLFSSTKSKQSADKKINVSMARVVTRTNGSFVGVFSDIDSSIGDLDLLPSLVEPVHQKFVHPM
jgi:hypothetical protein